jgi:PAS domain S-box-containing protein
MVFHTRDAAKAVYSNTHLQQFITWLVPLAIGFAILLCTISIVFQDLLKGACGVLVAAFGGLLVVVRSTIRRGQLNQAVLLLSISLLLLGFAINVLQPNRLLAFIPLLAVAVALPYVNAQTLKLLVVVSGVVSGLTLLISVIVVFQELPMRDWFGDMLAAFGISVVVGLILLLLWQYSDRLTEHLTQLQATHAALVESEARYRVVTELTSDCIYSLELHTNGSITALWVSDTVYNLTEYTAEEIALRGGWHTIVHPDDAQLFGRMWLIPTGQPITRELRLVTKSGDVRWVRDMLRTERHPGSNQAIHVFGALSDLTTLKLAEADKLAMERKMQDAQRLESLGVLTGGIAHDFNNLLAVMLGNLEMVRLDLSENSDAMSALESAENAGRRAADLIQQMLAYAGKGQYVIRVQNLNDLIGMIVPLLSSSVAKNVNLQFNLSSSELPIKADTAQLHQVLMNLVINASEAISGSRGTIQVITRQEHIESLPLTDAYQPLDIQPGVYTVLQVIDTGCGMHQHTLQRIFDPFFTTKFTGRGLGLAAVLGIVRGHRGGLMVQSSPDQGTTFTLLFPPAHSQTYNTASSSTQNLYAASGSLTHPTSVNFRRQLHDCGILIIDDEEGVRTATARMLKWAGAQVLEAHNGTTGVEMFAANADQINVVLLDLTMPDLDGTQVFADLQRYRPGVNVVVMSGHATEDMMQQFGSVQPSFFLHKPFTMNDLFRALATISKLGAKIASAAG